MDAAREGKFHDDNDGSSEIQARPRETRDEESRVREAAHGAAMADGTMVDGTMGDGTMGDGTMGDPTMGASAMGDDAASGDDSPSGENAKRWRQGVPQLVITATLESLTALEPGLLRDRFPIPARTVQRLACDAVITPLVVDHQGRPLSLGRTFRSLPPAQKRALIARDRHCQIEGCDAPADWCVPHHIDPWGAGGSTGLDDEILICFFHHWLVHEGRHTLAKSNGLWILVPPAEEEEVMAAQAV
jgi:hypothetical protein